MMISGKNIYSSFLCKIFLPGLILLSTGNSYAASDMFMPYVYTRVTQYSNLIRVANDAEAISVAGDTDTDDTVRTAGAGLLLNLPVSRQLIKADVLVERANYSTFNSYDHTRTDGEVVWRWQAGNLWEGNLGYTYRESLSADYEFQEIIRDMRTRKTVYFDAGYQLTPDVRLVAGLNKTDQSYEERSNLDRELRSDLVEIQYRNTINTQLGLRAKVTKSDFQNLDVNLNSPNSKETEISGLFKWEGTDKSRFEASFGATDQEYDDYPERNIRGSIGRVTYQWLMTRKTSLDVSLWRETDYDFDQVTAYVVTEGVSIKPTWLVTGKISVSGTISVEKDDFDIDQGSREDEVRLFNIVATIKPTRNVNVSLAYQMEERTSNDPDSEFDYSHLDLNVRFNF